MKPTKKLLRNLKDQNLIGSVDLVIDNFIELETAILSHIIDSAKRGPNVVWFDGECIENPHDYQHLIEEFIAASHSAPHLENVKCDVDFEAQRAECRATKDGSLISASWTQNSDWVESEFLDFAFDLCATAGGGFVYLDSGDQTYLTAFMAGELYKDFGRYRDKELKSRQAFFTGQNPQTKARYGDIEILPVEKHNAVLTRFMHTYIAKTGSVRECCDYLNGQAIEVAYAGKYTDAFSAYKLIKAAELKTEWYADLSQYEYQDLCPDEECYYINLDSAHDRIIFFYDAKSVPDLMGDMSARLGDYLIVGASNEWAICVKERSLICVGDPVIRVVKPVLKSAAGNENAQFYDWYTEQHYHALLKELGYKKDSGGVQKFYSKRHAKVLSTILVKARQSESHDPLEFIIDIGLLSPEIERLLDREFESPKYSFEFASRFAKGAPENRVFIESKSEFDRKAAEVSEIIRSCAAWADGPIGYQDLISAYQNNDDDRRITAAKKAAEHRGRTID